MILKKYAAIDIGSNAIRLLITNVVEQENKATQFNKNELFRVPIRLGKDSFTIGEISDKNQERMNHTHFNLGKDLLKKSHSQELLLGVVVLE